ncbi:uncharacterized protein phf11 isoform 2-T2 [Spinachia spinachia]
MDNRSKVLCALCQRGDETKVTGALATKDYVTAHQNCLLYSSGICCSCSPQYDDLFGFSVADVLAEVKRGSKLMCYRCQTRGATAGCEVKRCNKSYHYPCAVQHKAMFVEDAVQGKYELFCFKHRDQKQSGPTKVTRASEFSSDSNSGRPSSSKRRLSFQDKPKGNPSKRKAAVEIFTEDSSDSDVGADEDMVAFGPVETDSNSSPKAELIREDGKSPAGSTSGSPPVNGTMAGAKEDDNPILRSDCESESLLPASPSSRFQSTLYPRLVLLKSEVDGTVSPPQDEINSPLLGLSGAGSPPLPHHSLPLNVPRSAASTSSPPDTSFTFPTLAPPSSLKPDLNSTSFWKNCNAAGCTQALFAGFLNEMNAVCSRIQSDRASREDYDHALAVMIASGTLEEVVAKQQEGV